MEKRSHILLKLVPIMLAFFAMGFVDLVGIATNYVKKDFELSDSVANLFTSMVFFWFLVCSVPTGMPTQNRDSQPGAHLRRADYSAH